MQIPHAWGRPIQLMKKKICYKRNYLITIPPFTTPLHSRVTEDVSQKKRARCTRTVCGSFPISDSFCCSEANISQLPRLRVFFFVVIDYYSWKTFSFFTYRYYNQLCSDIRQWGICRSSRPVPCIGCRRAFSMGIVLPRLHSRLGCQRIPQQMWWQKSHGYHHQKWTVCVWRIHRHPLG